MAFKFEIIDNALVVTDTSDSSVAFDKPAGDTYYRTKELDEGVVSLFDTSGVNDASSVIFSKPLSECIDSSDAPFTATSFRAFARPNLGKDSPQESGQIIVTQKNLNDTLGGDIDSSKLYLISGNLDVSGINIEIPESGITILGNGFDISGLSSSSDNYTLFTSPVGGSGNLFMNKLSISISGVNSKVYNLNDSDGSHTIEIGDINFNNCSSLGELNGYRQMLETGTGRFLGTPELTFSGNWNGVRISTSIVRALSNITSLFKNGTSLTFSGRFISDINCDLPSSGALFDFSELNINNDESLIINGAFITRNGVINSDDTTIYPNINNTSVKSLWSDNTGIPNTTKYIKGSISTEVVTNITSTGVYFPLNGTYTINDRSHFDSPVNGQFRLLSGNGSYQISGDYILNSGQNNEVHLRVTKSTDGGVTFPTEINHLTRTINNFAGGRDVGFFPINFIANLKEGDIVRLEVENVTATNNITAEVDSYFIITAV